MHIGDIVNFWHGQQNADNQGRWAHRLDRKVLDASPYTFNLDHPVSPYVGDVLTAPVLILNANAKYDSAITPGEFPTLAAVEAYVGRVDDPSHADWSFVSSYYDDTNYGHLIGSGKAALINACAYRSPTVSPEVKGAIQRLPSSIFARRWLLEAVLDMAKNGKRLIVVKRGGQWRLPSSFSTRPGVSADPYPRFARLHRAQISNISDFIGSQP